MLKIYTSAEKLQEIQEIIATQDRMDELVSVLDYMEKRPEVNGNTLIVNSSGIQFQPDWDDNRPPYILPENILFSDNNFLSIVYFLLGNTDAAFSFLKENPSLQRELEIIEMIKFGQSVDPQILSVETFGVFDDYRLMHNHAVLRHYQDLLSDGKVEFYYNSAIDDAPDDEFRAYTAKHYVNYLFDQSNIELAEKIASQALKSGISEYGAIELKNLLVKINSIKLTRQDVDLDLMRSYVKDISDKFEAQERFIPLAMLLEDAANFSKYDKEYSEAVSYINRAIQIYQENQVVELLPNALYRKGNILYAWAISGNPQFYKSAAESFQEAIKYFRKEDFPLFYADIQHFLGVIYSVIPGEVNKKSIWAAVSSSSFKAALEIFDKERFPYEYGLVCNSYANALTKYPQAVLTDNIDKALYFYAESLDVRDADKYPHERALTILNYLEAQWDANNSEDENNPSRFQEMWKKAHEVLSINISEDLNDEAEKHIEKLKKLKELQD